MNYKEWNAKVQSLVDRSGVLKCKAKLSLGDVKELEGIIDELEVVIVEGVSCSES